MIKTFYLILIRECMETIKKPSPGNLFSNIKDMLWKANTLELRLNKITVVLGHKLNFYTITGNGSSWGWGILSKFIPKLYKTPSPTHGGFETMTSKLAQSSWGGGYWIISTWKQIICMCQMVRTVNNMRWRRKLQQWEIHIPRWHHPAVVELRTWRMFSLI